MRLTSQVLTQAVRGVVLAIAGVGIVGMSADPAAAKIRCSKGYQVVQGSLLSTPYCQDNYLAQVAREYGMRYSARSIRQNPNLKKHVCRLVRTDIRVQHNCDTILPRRGHF